jgi:uncharacterized RDD family membrane protein YckC
MSEREPAILGHAAGGGQAVIHGTSGGYGPPPSGGFSRGPAAAPDRAVNTFFVAGFWRRLGAGLTDLAALTPVCLLMTWLAGAISGLHLPITRHRGLDFWLDLVLGTDPALMGGIGLSLAIALIYALVFQATWGRTPGMRLLKVRVIDLYGAPPSIGRAAARSAAYLASAATLGLGFLWIGFDSEKRGLHDWLSGTYVVKETP